MLLLLSADSSQHLHSDIILGIDIGCSTTKVVGLPVGPICNPGLSAIKAAIYPADTNYYFFALGTDKKSHFFTDYNEHLKFINSSEYQPIYS